MATPLRRAQHTVATPRLPLLCFRHWFVVPNSVAGADLKCRKRGGRGRLFCHPTAFGEELQRQTAADQQWTRLLDERACLEAAGIRAEAAEEARITAKVWQKLRRVN